MTISDVDEKPSRLRFLYSLAVALFTHLAFVIVVLMGAVTIYGMVQNYRAGEISLGPVIGFGLFGIVMIVIGIGFFYVAYVGAPRFLDSLEQRRDRYRDRPWMANKKWRSRRIVASKSFTMWFMWFWTILWWSGIAVIWSVNGDLILAEMRASWSQALAASGPLFAGAIGLLVAISVSWQNIRHGSAVLQIETLPGFLGEEFRGTVIAGSSGRISEPAQVVLTCASLTSKKRRGTNGWETVWVTDEIWSATQTLHPTQTAFTRGRTSLPVRFKLPEGLPEYGDILDDPQIIWTLEVLPGTVLDKSIACSFHVPVYARR